MNVGYGVLLAGAAACMACCCSCSRSETSSTYVEKAKGATKRSLKVDKAFQITWPLEDPLKPRRVKARTLLAGQLHVETTERGTSPARMTVRITLSRPKDDAFRQYWNEHLMYRQFGWMDQVRVWDTDRKWLYPNLAYLFKLHGVDRVGRYGGWDPGKQVDNDFGAVLIRVFQVSDEVGRPEKGRAEMERPEKEYPETESAPLVSADWHADDARGVSRYAIVHRARSDDFTINLPADLKPTWLRAKVWLIYGDFFGQPRPRSWPAESGGVGGALAFFTIDWDYRTKSPQLPAIQQQRPEPTRFDWTEWIGRAEEDAEPIGTPRLTVSVGMRHS